MSMYSIDGQTMSGIADAARWRTGTYDSMTIDKMIGEMKKHYGIYRKHTVDILPEEPLVRPAGWPDLDSLNLQMSGDDFIYMTYDANKEASAISWHIETEDKQPATFDIGHIENGVYVVDETHSVSHNTNYIRWTDDLSGYLVLRVTGQIARCYSVNATRDGQTQHFRQQPILERIAWVPHLVSFCTTYSGNAWTMYTLEREKVANGDGTALKNLYYAWAYGRRLQSLDISGLYTPNITDMTDTFYYCQMLKSLDLRHWSTAKVVTFLGVFNCCYGLQSIDIRGWDTSHAINLSYIFSGCRSLTEIKDIASFDTSSATNFSNMFNECYSLAEFPVTGWDTSNVTNLSYMFSNCYALEELDLSGWDVGKVTNLSNLFSQCQALKRICFDGWQTAELTNLNSMFYHCESLESVDISWIHVTDKCTNIYSMFSYCSSLKELDIPSDWDVSGLSDANNTANSMFYNCYSLERLTGIANWQFNLNNSLTNMFSNCRSLRELDVSGWKVDTATSLAGMFQYCYSLERLDLGGWQTDNCTNMSAMFQGCWSLKSIGDISGWDTSKVTNFSSMFADCVSLPELPDIGGWDFSQATTVASMFSGMMSVKEITLRSINLANCTTIATMFRYCRGLEKITLTGWSIPKVTATAPAQFLADNPNLRDVTIDLPITLNHSYNGDEALSHESLLNILNSLPTVTTRRTLNLLTQNINRLTAEEKQIATNKNWTLAN